FHPTLNPLAQPAELCLFLLCVWLLLLLSIAVADAAFSQLRSIAAVACLATLLAVCILIYLLLSLASQLSIYLAYALCALYILATLIYYFTHVRAHYLCGRCGAKMRQKGVCPRCGAVND
ncbi:MAG: zinc ribbon domain-containing protein, partial [Bacteroidaceae bacterium]|nr:zinc ribbon domain-containing protein [Bacteroidaceae bacterium]